MIQNEADSLSKVDLYKKLWDGTLSFSSNVYFDNRWLPLDQHPLMYTGPQGALIRIVRNLDGSLVPYCTLFLVFMLNMGSWFQDSHLTTRWAHGWSNIFLEGRWWSIGTGFIVHSSKSHFLSNVILMLFLGWRVERAIGSLKYSVLVLVSVCVSCVSVWIFEEGMVVGASSIVFTLWGAQIAIGLLFPLPPRHRSRYGWWGLLLLMVVFVTQVGSVQIAHSSHIIGVWMGAHGILFVLSRFWGFVLLFASVCCLFIQDVSHEKRQDLDGLTIVMPKDFVAHTVGETHVWFHPFDTSGWVVQGQNSSLLGLNRYWQKYNFNTGFTERCNSDQGCIQDGDSHEINLKVVHLGPAELTWIACIYPKDAWLWRKSCSSWIGGVEPKKPNILGKKRLLMERYPRSEYHLEQYALTLERWGYYQEADLMYTQLLDSAWKVRAKQHRTRLQQRLLSQ